MKEPIDLKVGDFAVIERTWRYALVEVTKVTAKQFEATGEWGSRAHRYDRRCALFAGEQAKAKKVFDQLTSSDAQFEEDKRKAGERRDKRNAEFIERAMN